MKVHLHLRLLFVALTYGKVSLWLWKSLENSEFFLLLCGTGHPLGLVSVCPKNFTFVNLWQSFIQAGCISPTKALHTRKQTCTRTWFLFNRPISPELLQASHSRLGQSQKVNFWGIVVAEQSEVVYSRKQNKKASLGTRALTQPNITHKL